MVSLKAVAGLQELVRLVGQDEMMQQPGGLLDPDDSVFHYSLGMQWV